MHARIVDEELVMLNVSTNKILVCTNSTTVRSKLVFHDQKYYPLATKEGPIIENVNFRIMQSKNHISFDQTPCYFLNATYLSACTPLRIDCQVENDIVDTTQCIQSKLDELNVTCGEFQSNYGTILNSSVNSRLEVSYSMIRIGHFIAILFRLGYVLLHKVMHYLKTHMNKPLIFPKNESSSNIKIILHWHANKSEELVFDSYLESFQDTNHASEKILRSSYGIYM